MPASSTAVALPGWIDPARVFAGGPARHPHGFWLDAGPAATDGWSWIGIGAREPDPERVEQVVCAAAEAGTPGVWGPFRGGWVGWLGYEDAAAQAGAPASASDPDVPQVMWLRVDRFVAFDHGARRVWAVAPDGEEGAFAGVVQAWAEAPVAAPDAVPNRTAVARHPPIAYAELIERCRESIRQGDAYQLCLTTRFSVTGQVDPVAAYLTLRASSGAHHGGLVRSDGVALASASPERFLEVREGVVRTRPIKGTRPRGMDAATDARLASELLDSAKERAENVMIVDLMRNDLSRVCRAGTVTVEELLAVESYPTVHQLVSTVSGVLERGTTVGELLRAAFPAGSMTGAPKLSAMTILHGLEAAPRGTFSGCYGWVGLDGALDLGMVIRSIVTHPAGAYVGAGGGITWRSEPWDEVAEVGIKARGPLAAIGAQLPSGW